jgi:membrane protein implicated in regulation of membrane protease activity
VARGDDKSVTRVVQELWQLTRDYARQETLDPLKNLGNYLKFGLPGALLVATGVLFFSLAILRGLQQVTPLTTGWWWWVPYLAATAFLVVVAALCGRGIKTTMTTTSDRDSQRSNKAPVERPITAAEERS